MRKREKKGRVWDCEREKEGKKKQRRKELGNEAATGNEGDVAVSLFLSPSLHFFFLVLARDG